MVLTRFFNLGLISIMMIGCSAANNFVKHLSCDEVIPEEVTSHFEKTTSKGILKHDPLWYSIIEGRHDDLFTPQFGIIASKKFGWKQNLEFQPILLYENDKYFLIEISSQGDRIRFFAPIFERQIVIRKQDGKIIKTLDLDKILDKKSYVEEKFIFNDFLYMKTATMPGYEASGPSKILCMKIGE